MACPLSRLAWFSSFGVRLSFAAFFSSHLQPPRDTTTAAAMRKKAAKKDRRTPKELNQARSHPRRRDDLFRRVGQIRGGLHRRQLALRRRQDLACLLDVGALEPHHHRHLEADLAPGLD